jgi:hypothetical protein
VAEAAGLGTAELTGATVEAYLAARRASGYTAYLTPKALTPLLGSGLLTWRLADRV